jgi:predicted PolB exonuclease-like 3'-5' exonuclease
MFSQQVLSKLLFFDIETAGRYATYEEFKLADPDGAKVYAGKCERMNYGDPAEGYLNKVSLFPEFGRIVCLSYGVWKNGEISIATVSDENEADLIKKVANLFHKAGAQGMIPCGWNIKNFDIPWVYRKCLMHGIQVPESVNTWGKKPWEVSITDLKEWWKGFSNLDVTFEEAAYGLGIPSPKDEMHGGQVHDNYWFKDNLTGVKHYCEKDVKTMIIMCEKIYKNYYTELK